MTYHVVTFHNYSRVAGILLALSQLVLGGTLITLQGLGIYKDIISTHLGATAIWAGVFIIFCGITGIVAARLQIAGALLSFMVLSVVSTLMAPAIVITSTVSIMELKHYCETHVGAQRCDSDLVATKRVIDLALIIVAVVEYCLAASCAITCCWTLCCDPARHQDMKTSHEEQRSANSMEMQPHYETSIVPVEP